MSKWNRPEFVEKFCEELAKLKESKLSTERRLNVLEEAVFSEAISDEPDTEIWLGGQTRITIALDQYKRLKRIEAAAIAYDALYRDPMFSRLSKELMKLRSELES